MPIEFTPLDDAALPPSVRKVASVVAPRQLRLMAARGMAPLPPAEMVLALFQIVVTEPSESPVREAAEATARDLPDAILSPALAAGIDARVLDYYARSVGSRPSLVRVLLANHAVADDTFVYLAKHATDETIEQIAQNEMRLLRHPAIITALYLNPKTRMSTAQRAIELAIRNNIRVEGIIAFEDLKSAIEADGAPDASVDAAFESALRATEGARASIAAGDTDEGLAQEAEEADQRAEKAVEAAPDQAMQIGKLPMAARMRLATLGNVFARAILVRDKNRVIALAAVRNPGTTEHEAERFAANRALHEDVIRFLAGQRQFTRRYSVKRNLVNNPKCPLQVAMGFLGHLTAKDLRLVARSKGVPSAVAKTAQGLMSKREPR